MIKLLFPAIFFVVVSQAVVFADKSQAPTFVPLGLTPLFDSPVPGGFPVSYLEPEDTCRIDSTKFDTSNVEWAFVKSQSRSGWLQKSSVRPTGGQSPAQQSSGGNASVLDDDAKRRYRIVEKHPEWDRRIVKVIRDGKICLDMNDAQLLASWGEPLQKSTAFILGAGNQDLWIYKGQSGTYETVFLVKGRIVGWSN
jgi:hypothetical protein